MGTVSITRLIMIATTVVSVSSRFTSHKGNDLATYIHNRDSHYEFLETHAYECCSEMIKETSLTGACKDTPWIQVACIVSLSTTDIIFSYDTTKKYLLDHVLDNTVAGRSGASIGQVAKNPSDMSKKD